MMPAVTEQDGFHRISWTQRFLKLDVLNAARSLEDLRSPPGNRPEALRGDLRGFHGIRVNKQWRIIFRWEVSEAHDVKIIDYHPFWEAFDVAV